MMLKLLVIISVYTTLALKIKGNGLKHVKTLSEGSFQARTLGENVSKRDFFGESFNFKKKFNGGLPMDQPMGIVHRRAIETRSLARSFLKSNFKSTDEIRSKFLETSKTKRDTVTEDFFGLASDSFEKYDDDKKHSRMKTTTMSIPQMTTSRNNNSKGVFTTNSPQTNTTAKSNLTNSTTGTTMKPPTTKASSPTKKTTIKRDSFWDE